MGAVRQDQSLEFRHAALAGALLLIWATRWGWGGVCFVLAPGGMRGQSISPAAGLSMIVALALAAAGLLLLARRGPWQAGVIALGAGLAHRVGFVVVPGLLSLLQAFPTPALTAIRRASVASTLSIVIPEVICLSALAWFIVITGRARRAERPDTSPQRDPRDPAIILSVLVLLAYHGADLMLLPGRVSTISRSLIPGASAPANMAVLVIGSIAALAALGLGIGLIARIRSLTWPTVFVLGISMLYVLATQVLARGTWAPALGTVGPWAVTSLLERCVLIVAVIASCSGGPDRPEKS